MKINKTFSALALGLTAATVAQALPSGPQVTPIGNPVYISGSTAFRPQVFASLGDLGLTNQPGDANGNNIFTFSGTINTNKVSGLPAGLAGSQYTVYCSFDGSAQGVNEMVNTSLQQNFEDIGAPSGAGVATFTSPSDLALSDVSQGSTQYPSTPSLYEIVANVAKTNGVGTGIAVQPFMWLANAYAASNINNITDQQIDGLFTSGELPLNFWTGNLANTNQFVKLTGRDNSSGTRITAIQLASVQQDSTLTTASLIHQYTVGGGVGTPGSSGNTGPWTAVGNSGYGSGGNVGKALGGLGVPTNDTSMVVGYISFGDAKGVVDSTIQTAGTTLCTAINYNGVSPILTYPNLPGTNFEYNIPAVENGEWPFWSYEHLYASLNDDNGTTQNATVNNLAQGLVDGVEYEIGQQNLTTAANPQTAILIGNMNVSRTEDGGLVSLGNP